MDKPYTAQEAAAMLFPDSVDPSQLDEVQAAFDTITAEITGNGGTCAFTIREFRAAIVAREDPNPS